MTAVAASTPAVRTRRRIRWPRIALHAFLISWSALWLFPLLWTVYTALRPYSDTAGPDGYVSIAHALTLDNFTSAWTGAQLPLHFFNTLVVAVPAVIITLFVSSMLGFAFSRFPFRFNIPLLMIFTAGNLLPAAGHHRAALPAVPPPAGAQAAERQRAAVRPVHRDHPDPRRVPDRLLHVRAQQLHEDALEGADRGRPGRWRLGLDDLPPGHPAAVPAGPGGPARPWSSRSSTTTSSGR